MVFHMIAAVGSPAVGGGAVGVVVAGVVGVVVAAAFGDLAGVNVLV